MKALKTLGNLMIDTKDLEGSHTWDEAKKQIEFLNNLNYQGFSNWQLPTREELNKMYLNKDEIGSFSVYGYWSSTENSTGTAWNQSFYFGYQYYSDKNYNLLVRCVRSI